LYDLKAPMREVEEVPAQSIVAGNKKKSIDQ
jgi:hypothetical protein